MRILGKEAIVTILSLVVIAASASSSFFDDHSWFQRESTQAPIQNSVLYRSPMRYPFNPGLPEFLHDSRETAPSEIGRHKLFILIHLPSFNLFENPSSFFQTYQQTAGSTEMDPLGHVQWAWSCKLNGRLQEGASGYTGEQNRQALQLVEKGWGATAALVSFGDGHFESPKDVQKRALISMRANRLAKWEFNVTEGECLAFLKKYKSLRFEAGPKRFGFLPFRDPNTSNCVEIARELFSEVLGFPKSIFEKSQREFIIPLALFGWPNKTLPLHVSITERGRNQLKSRKGKFVNPAAILAATGSWSNSTQLDKASLAAEFVRVKLLTPERLQRALLETF